MSMATPRDNLADTRRRTLPLRRFALPILLLAGLSAVSDDRFPDRAALQQQVCDATIRNPYTRMPPFCRHGILTNQEVELIIDYLYTL